MRITRRRLVVAAATILSLSLITAGCSTDDAAPETAPPLTAPAPEAGPSTGFPVTVDVYGTPFTVAARPERIVSLSPSSTEGLFAIGAGPQVVAVDEFSDFPAEAPTTALSGFTPNVEAIVEFAPDLVVVSYDPGDLVASLAATGIPVLVLDAAVDLEDALRQLVILGAVTGNDATAAAVVEDLELRIAEVVAAAPTLDEPLTYFHELDDTLVTVTSSTFVGSVYGLLGLVNVADAADPDGASSGYPQLSSEFLLLADPDLVFLADSRCCGEDATTFAARPGFGELQAVTTGAVVVLDDDVASRWGPRIVDFLEQVAAAVAQHASDTPVGTM
jgi:iron complex transport system substrate-binding protein